MVAEYSGFHPNPIRKTVVASSHGMTPPYTVRLLRGWRATCPDCGEEIRSYGVGTSTRKQAKDALHKHQSKKGGIFGCKGSPPAVVGSESAVVA